MSWSCSLSLRMSLFIGFPLVFHSALKDLPATLQVCPDLLNPKCTQHHGLRIYILPSLLTFHISIRQSITFLIDLLAVFLNNTSKYLFSTPYIPGSVLCKHHLTLSTPGGRCFCCPNLQMKKLMPPEVKYLPKITQQG